MLYTKFKGHKPAAFGEDFGKVFIIYGHGGNLGKITWISWIHFCSLIPLRLNIKKFVFD